MAQSLLKSTTTVGGMTLISRVLGFFRDMIVARLLGAGTGADAFFVAFKIPNFLRRLFAEGAFSQAFVPVLSEYKSKREYAETQQFVNDLAGTLGGVLLVVTLLGVIGAPIFVLIFAPGFWGDATKYDLTVEMLRITFPYLFFISLTAFAGGILNTYGKFGVPAFTPIFLNLSLIFAATVLAPYFDEPAVALAWGVFIAGIVQLIFQLPFLKQLRFLPRPRWAWRSEPVQRVIKLMVPVIFGSSVVQVNLLLDTVIASFLVTGSVSWLYYSDRLVEFPLGVFGIALATVVLPNLSKKHAEAATDSFGLMIDWALRLVLLIAVPATLGLIILAGPMLVTLFQYGAFGEHDVRMATLSLMTYSLGLPAFILVKILANGFFARQDTKTPVRIGIYAVIANMVSNALIVIPMQYLDIPGGHAALAFSTSMAAFLNCGMLYHLLRQQGVYKPQPGWAKLGLQISLASIVMAVVLWWSSSDVTVWFAMSGYERVLRLSALIAMGGIAYALVLLSLGVRARHFRNVLKS